MSVLLSSIKTLSMEIGSILSNKAYFLTEDGSTMHVQFNPENFKITRAANYSYTSQKKMKFPMWNFPVRLYHN